MLLPPVEYRAGADLAHAHAGVQLWLDAAHGSVAHHRSDGHGEMSDDSTGAESGSVQSGAAVDTPRWTNLSPVVERAAIASALVVVLTTALVARAVLTPTVTVALVGRSTRPESPPPRTYGRVSLAT